MIDDYSGIREFTGMAPSMVSYHNDDGTVLRPQNQATISSKLQYPDGRREEQGFAFEE